MVYLGRRNRRAQTKEKEMRIVWQTKNEETTSVTKVSRELTEAEAQIFEQKLDEHKKVHHRVKNLPSVRTLKKWMFNGICPTPDGCKVEPDGTCEHGWNAWLLIMGVI